MEFDIKSAPMTRNEIELALSDARATIKRVQRNNWAFVAALFVVAAVCKYLTSSPEIIALAGSYGGIWTLFALGFCFMTGLALREGVMAGLSATIGIFVFGALFSEEYFKFGLLSSSVVFVLAGSAFSVVLSVPVFPAELALEDLANAPKETCLKIEQWMSIPSVRAYTYQVAQAGRQLTCGEFDMLEELVQKHKKAEHDAKVEEACRRVYVEPVTGPASS